MDCKNCENIEKCQQIQENVATARDLWSKTLQGIVDALDVMAIAECNYAKDPSTESALSEATENVFAAFSAMRSVSNPFAPPTTGDKEPLPETSPVSVEQAASKI